MNKRLIDRQLVGDFLVLLFFFISGNPAFTHGFMGKYVNILMFLVILAVVHFKIPVKCWKEMLRWSFLLGMIFMCQFFLLGHITILGSANYVIKMMCAIMLAFTLGDSARDSALRVMTVLCLISLFFYSFNLFGIRFPSLVDIQSKSQSLIIYTQTWDDETGSLFRNSGPFWEPGAFAGYIIIVLLLHIDQVNELWNKHKYEVIVLFLTLLTTTSTTGYIVMMFLLVYNAVKLIDNKYLSVACVALLLTISVFAFVNFDFLGEKIQNEIFDIEIDNPLMLNYSRFGSIIFDAQYIASHPLFGNGLDFSTRYRFHDYIFTAEELTGFGNGFTGSIASMGLLFMLAFIIGIYFNPTLKRKWGVILSVILLLQGEYFLNYPLIMILPFVDFGSETVNAKHKFKFIWRKKEIEG